MTDVSTADSWTRTTLTTNLVEGLILTLVIPSIKINPNLFLSPSFAGGVADPCTDDSVSDAVMKGHQTTMWIRETTPCDTVVRLPDRKNRIYVALEANPRSNATKQKLVYPDPSVFGLASAHLAGHCWRLHFRKKSIVRLIIVQFVR